MDGCGTYLFYMKAMWPTFSTNLYWQNKLHVFSISLTAITKNMKTQVQPIVYHRFSPCPQVSLVCSGWLLSTSVSAFYKRKSTGVLDFH